MTRIAGVSIWLVAPFLMPGTWQSAGAQSGIPASPEVASYVGQGLDIMESNSLDKKTIDWKTLRQSTLSKSSQAKNTYETYDAIRYALSQLGDHHSFLQLSPDLVRKENEAKKTRPDVSSPKPPSEAWPPSPYIERREPEGSLEEFGSENDERIREV